MALRVYLSGRNPQGEAAAALAVSNPRNPGYADYLSPAQYEQQFGPSPGQVSAVSSWLASAGMTITAASNLLEGPSQRRGSRGDCRPSNGPLARS